MFENIQAQKLSIKRSCCYVASRKNFAQTYVSLLFFVVVLFSCICDVIYIARATKSKAEKQKLRKEIKKLREKNKNSCIAKMK